MVEMVSLFGILGVFSLEDMQKRKVTTMALLLSGIIGMVLHLCYGRLTIWNLMGGFAIGVVFYIASVLSGGQIGKGDALLIMVTGIFLGFWNNLMLVWAAACLAGFAGLVAVLGFHKPKSYELPFVPFLLAAYVLCLVVWGGTIDAL